MSAETLWPLTPWPSQTTKRWKPCWPFMFGASVYVSWFTLYGLPGWCPQEVAKANLVIALNRSLVGWPSPDGA